MAAVKTEMNKKALIEEKFFDYCLIKLGKEGDSSSG
jgi:hypothetical protein